MVAKNSDKILIVGAGCFGLSTAYHLLKSGYTDITVIDKAETLPAPDGSSNDLNRLVRSSYDDPYYTQLVGRALQAWKNREEWGDTYHESGVVFLGEIDYIRKAYQNDVELGARTKKLDDIKNAFPLEMQDKVASQTDNDAYVNYDGGWANAGLGISKFLGKVSALGGKIIPGKAVEKLIQIEGKTVGVECTDGTNFTGLDLLLLAAGAWTRSIVPDAESAKPCLATGQSVAFVQLTPEEGEAYRNCPAVLNFSNGFYCFPPTSENLLKFAIHGRGYTQTLPNGVSTPRTILTDPERGLCIPKEMVLELRTKLGLVYPELAKKPFVRTRLCWYTDSPDGDWMIGPHPTDKGIFFATAGSGHAYKFLPVIGDVVAKAIQGTLEPDIMKKFAIDRQFESQDGSREGREAVRELDLSQLAEAQDLLAV